VDPEAKRRRPTFAEDQYWVEVYIFDFSDDLYDRRLTIKFLHRIRPVMRFAGVKALKRQVAADLETARRLLREQAPGD